MHVLLSLQTIGTVVVLVLAVITKYYRLGSLNNKYLALEAGTKALADSESGERLPCGS